jgi:hypothetical protein
MSKFQNESNCLASLALFRGMYDSNNDVYSILCEFIKDIIINEAKYSFSLSEINHLLNSTYDFKIPDAVTKTAIRKIDGITLNNGIYSIDRTKISIKNNLSNIKSTIIQDNDSIIEKLIKFVEKEIDKTVDEEIETLIVHAFCQFLLDNSYNENYSDLVSAFFLENSDDESFMNKINQIREGVILYSGIKYNGNLNETSNWRTEFTIYLDTEILFHFAGYNGTLYKSHFDDFYMYVREINHKAQTTLIKLRFLGDVKNEIEGFFTKAKYLIDGNAKPNPSGSAMNAIVNGCKTAADILIKKSDFYHSLTSIGIIEDEKTVSLTEENFRYNIIDQSIIKELSEELEFDITQALECLNQISLRRRENNSDNFENCKYILLTGNKSTLTVSWHNRVKNEGEVPFATTLHWMTNKFWFRLHKGFGINSFPKSFDVISKSQILLSTQLNESIGEKYEELKSEIKGGRLTEDQAKARIVHLRKSTRNPEEIEKDEIETILEFITDDSIDKFIEEQEFIRINALKTAEENTNLQNELDGIKRDLNLTQEDLNNKLQEITESDFKRVKSNLASKQDLINVLSVQMDNIKTKSKNRLFWYKFKLILFAFLWVSLLTSLIIIFKWNDLEMWTFYIPAILFALSLIYIVVYEKKFSINARILHQIEKRKEYFFSNEIFKQKFNLEKFELIKLEIDNLENEINTMKEDNDFLI